MMITEAMGALEIKGPFSCDGWEKHFGVVLVCQLIEFEGNSSAGLTK